jgi:hypothetical protein
VHPVSRQPFVTPRTEREIERAVTHPDLDYELHRAAKHRWAYNPSTGLYARPEERRAHVNRRNGGLTGTYTELIYSNPLAFTAKNTFTAEFQINDQGANTGPPPALPAWYFLPSGARGKTLRIVARGIQLGTGSTPPTWILTFRLNPVVTPANPPTGPIIGALPGATTMTGTTTANTLWEAELDVQLTLEGAPGNNSTLRGLGMWSSPRGFTSPFFAELFGGGASPGTVATFDLSLLNTLTVGMTCGTSLAANQMQLLQLLVMGLN